MEEKENRSILIAVIRLIYITIVKTFFFLRIIISESTFNSLLRNQLEKTRTNLYHFKN